MSPRSPWLFATITTLAATALPAQTPDTVNIRTTPVAGGVYLLQGSGGNIAASTGPDGVIMVDDDSAPLTDRILAAVDQLHSGRVRFVYARFEDASTFSVKRTNARRRTPSFSSRTLACETRGAPSTSSSRSRSAGLSSARPPASSISSIAR